jgi:hypothetical protein
MSGKLVVFLLSMFSILMLTIIVTDVSLAQPAKTMLSIAVSTILLVASVYEIKG